MFFLRRPVWRSILLSADIKSMPLIVRMFGFGKRVLNVMLESSVRF